MYMEVKNSNDLMVVPWEQDIEQYNVEQKKLCALMQELDEINDTDKSSQKQKEHLQASIAEISKRMICARRKKKK